ncbi:hypothetical protein BD414DRAFT_503677 [Trametes punicea]|nr:hypothetical protein BD414DRAFT_503677 [Trametes punicea]
MMMSPFAVSINLLIAFLLLPLLLTLLPSVHAAASLTPPQLSSSQSVSGSVTLSASFTPTSALNASGSTGGTGDVSASVTSSAQFPSLSGLSDCANQCFALAISQDGCNSIVDVNCYCTNTTRFTSGLVACISTQCPGDLASVESISEQFCARAATSTSLSFPTPPPTTTFSDPFTSSTSVSASSSRNGTSSNVPSSSASSSTASSSGAQGNVAAASHSVIGFTGLFGLIIACAAVILA